LRSIKEEVFLKTDFKKRGTKKRITTKSWKTFAVAATACLVLFAGVGGGVVYAAEAKEYNAAVSFFNDYGLSTEGLSRGEIKAVYKDIKTERFEYSKTAEVIAMSITDSQVEGYEIMQSIVSPEDVENLWNYKNFAVTYSADGYRIHDEYKFDEERGYDVFDKSFFEKYEDDELVWQVSFEEFFINGYKEVQDGVIVYGMTPFSSDDEYAWLALIDDEGNVCWKEKFTNEFGTEHIADVFENEDGTYAVFSRGDLEYFCLSTVNADGKIIDFNKTEVGIYGIWNIARLGEGYVVQLGNSTLEEDEKIVKVDKKGNILDSFTYKSEDAFYHIVDMIEYCGKIYFSAYAVPMNNGYDIEPVLKYIFDNDKMDITDEELTPLVRDNYTAMLLVCDADDGAPEEFYSVKGSLGGNLEINGSGQLMWDVESIVTTFFSPATSSFTVGGTSCIFRYTFDNTGVLVNQEDTGESVVFRR
ncbi:MAG: hypothetical protein J6B39_04870, partial [Lachnospiraceae bacterium]|nr:hypothetical protein [Lachnospiraceae bacterium]